MKFSRLTLLWLLMLLLGLSGCDNDDDNDNETAAFELQLLHAADMDGATGALDNVGGFSAVLEALRGEYPNTLTLSSGDNYIPGPRFSAASDDSMVNVEGVRVPLQGRGDIAFLNAMGFQASAVGNHDLDEGTGTFAALISAEGDYPGTLFPYLSANLDFTTDGSMASLIANDGQAASDMTNSVAAYTVIDVNGETIGVVGASTPTLSSITNTGEIAIAPADSNDTAGLASEIQTAVDALIAADVNKIILLAHMQQINVEQELATLLRGVDIIVAGGSNSLLADTTDTLRDGDSVAGTYPQEYTSSTGEPVLLVNTDGDYKYVGRLVVGFDEEGVVLPGSVDENVSGAYATDATGVAAVNGTENAQVVAIRDALIDVLVERDGNILGKTDVYIDGRRSQVRTQETNMGNLTAEANLALAKSVDATVQISIKNGGGIRDDIGYFVYPPGSTSLDELEFSPPAANTSTGKLAGEISQFDIEGTLRFNNGLTLMTITAQELYDVIEHGVSEVENTAGRFPQIAGFRFSYDPLQAANSRVQSLEILDDADNVTDTVVTGGALQGDPNRTIRIVTLNFLAGGGDDYPFNTPPVDRVDLAGEIDEDEDGILDPEEDLNENGTLDPSPITDEGMAAFADPGSEQDALAEYLLENYSTTAFAEAETVVTDDERIVNLAP